MRPIGCGASSLSFAVLCISFVRAIFAIASEHYTFASNTRLCSFFFNSFFSIMPVFRFKPPRAPVKQLCFIGSYYCYFLEYVARFFFLLRSYNFLIVPAMRSLMFPYLSLVFLLQPYRLSKRNAQRTKQKIYLRCSSLLVWFVQ